MTTVRNPTGIPYRDGDFLVVTVRSSQATGIRFAFSTVDDDTGGRDMVIADAVGPTDRTSTQVRQVLSGDGEIDGADTNYLSGTAISQPGQVFVHAELFHGGTAISFILAGYIYNGHTPGFPGTLQGPLDGPGRIYTATGIDPAANVEVNDAVPVGARWRLIAEDVVFVTSAAVATRTPVWIIDGGNTPLIFAKNSENQTATQTRTHEIGIGGLGPATAGLTIADGAVTEFLEDALPPGGLLLQAGDRIRTATVNRDVNDNYAAPAIRVEEWLSP